MPKPKKDKSKAADKKARTEAKQNKKAVQKEKKAKVKGKGRGNDSDAEDVDLEAVLKEYAEQVGKHFLCGGCNFTAWLLVYSRIELLEPLPLAWCLAASSAPSRSLPLRPVVPN